MKLILAFTALAAIGYAQYPPPCPPICPKGGNKQTTQKAPKAQKPQAGTRVQTTK